MQSLLRDRGEPDSSLKTAEQIKEELCYVCPDIVKEFTRFDREPERFQKYVVEQLAGRKVTVDVGYERFLAPEIFFNPEIYSSDFLTPLPNVVDNVIQSSPIDVRRGLYKAGSRSQPSERLAPEMQAYLHTLEHRAVGRIDAVQGLWPPPAARHPSPGG